MGIKHIFVSIITDDPVADAAGEILPQRDWNDDHTIDGNIDFNGFGVLNISGIREKLEFDRTYFVKTTGNDNNDGLSAGQAFLTLQQAANVVGDLDTGSTASITIDIGAGTFDGCECIGPIPQGLGFITWQGAGQGSTIVTQNSPEQIAAFYISNLVNVVVDGLTCQGTGGSYGLEIENQAIVTGQNLSFVGVGSDSAVFVRSSSNVFLTGAIDWTGDFVYGIYTAYGTRVGVSQSGTKTLTGTPDFTDGFVFAEDTGVLESFLGSYTGAATGVRYYVTKNAVIDSFGKGANYFPGDVAGTEISGGVYL